MIKLKIASVLIFLLILGWWFRYDTHCGGTHTLACISYDRFTGQWFFPIDKVTDSNQ
jgi:hypothetical protein